jgi:hypothetical protein
MICKNKRPIRCQSMMLIPRMDLISELNAFIWNKSKKVLYTNITPTDCDMLLIFASLLKVPPLNYYSQSTVDYIIEIGWARITSYYCTTCMHNTSIMIYAPF